MRDPQDKRPFATSMQMLCATYQVEPTTALLAGYFIALQSLTIEEAQAAILWALGGGGKFMPTAHELREQGLRSRRKPWPGFPWDGERKRIAASWEGAPRLLQPISPAVTRHDGQSRPTWDAADPAVPAAGDSFRGTR